MPNKTNSLPSLGALINKDHSEPFSIADPSNADREMTLEANAPEEESVVEPLKSYDTALKMYNEEGITMLQSQLLRAFSFTRKSSL